MATEQEMLDYYYKTGKVHPETEINAEAAGLFPIGRFASLGGKGAPLAETFSKWYKGLQPNKWGGRVFPHVNNAANLPAVVVPKMAGRAASGGGKGFVSNATNLPVKVPGMNNITASDILKSKYMAAASIPGLAGLGIGSYNEYMNDEFDVGKSVMDERELSEPVENVNIDYSASQQPIDTSFVENYNNFLNNNNAVAAAKIAEIVADNAVKTKGKKKTKKKPIKIESTPGGDYGIQGEDFELTRRGMVPKRTNVHNIMDLDKDLDGYQVEW